MLPHQTDNRSFMQEMNLYCIVLLPNPEIGKMITLLKEEMHAKFNAAHALKSPAHITLQMPFRRNIDQEPVIVKALEHFSSCQSSFEISLSGFGCFAPKVIFIKISDHDPIVQLHSRLIRVLEDPIGLSAKEIMTKVFPHMTIATRDLSRTNFKAAWKELDLRSFKADFMARSLYLLKHNGKNWEIYREFEFEP